MSLLQLMECRRHDGLSDNATTKVQLHESRRVRATAGTTKVISNGHEHVVTYHALGGWVTRRGATGQRCWDLGRHRISQHHHHITIQDTLDEGLHTRARAAGIRMSAQVYSSTVTSLKRYLSQKHEYCRLTTLSYTPPSHNTHCILAHSVHTLWCWNRDTTTPLWR